MRRVVENLPKNQKIFLGGRMFFEISVATVDIGSLTTCARRSFKAALQRRQAWSSEKPPREVRRKSAVPAGMGRLCGKRVMGHRRD